MPISSRRKKFNRMNKGRIPPIWILSISLFFLPFLTDMLFAAEGIGLEKRIQRFTLENGLQVLVLPRNVSPTVSLYIRYRAGAVDEVDGKTGLAHLLEHMMFKGTRTIGTKNFPKETKILRQISLIRQAVDKETARADGVNSSKISKMKGKLKVLQERHKALIISNEIDRLYKENGAVHLNASTGQDMTTYHVSLPANKIELWARIESDRMMNPVFREFYQERDVVLEERRQRIDADPDGKLYESFLSAAFAAHPYRRPIIGWPSDIRHLTIKDLEAFFRQHHAPNKTVIAIVGDVEPGKVRKMMEKYFGNMPRREAFPPRITEEPKQMGERRVSVHLDANPQLIIGYHKPPPPAFEDYVFDVIEALLSHGRTSRFYRTLVEEKGIAESVQIASDIPGARYPSQFCIFATPRHPHGNEKLETAIYELIDKLKADPVPEEELQKIKNQVRAGFIRRQASNEGLASMLSYYQALLGDYRHITNYPDVIDKITAEDIRQVAVKYLGRDNRTVAGIVRE
jgi:predicted Zn-dependent peptidase